MVSSFILQPADPTRRPPAARLVLRFLAFLIDSLLVLYVIAVVGMGWGTETARWQWKLNGLPACGMMIFLPGYWLISESLFGATPGKLVFGMRILSLREGELAFGQVLKRNLAKLADLGTFGLTSFVVALSNPLRQSIGDLWAQTMVVEKRTYAKWRAGAGPVDFQDWLKSFPGKEETGSSPVPPQPR